MTDRTSGRININNIFRKHRLDFSITAATVIQHSSGVWFLIDVNQTSLQEEIHHVTENVVLPIYSM